MFSNPVVAGSLIAPTPGFCLQMLELLLLFRPDARANSSNASFSLYSLNGRGAPPSGCIAYTQKSDVNEGNVEMPYRLERLLASTVSSSGVCLELRTGIVELLHETANFNCFSISEQIETCQEHHEMRTDVYKYIYIYIGYKYV